MRWRYWEAKHKAEIERNHKLAREVDIRRRVAAVFNKVKDDFDSLDSYNDYLYMAECLTDDLVNGSDGARPRRGPARRLRGQAQGRD
ncbi:hypothetical protein PWT90_10833 [Aphanocladium album]|nr:hypothetical protein PWT90_10833 [Aphanocladium album]